jgi:DNA-binding beta-propeller fold protein YncE
MRNAGSRIQKADPIFAILRYTDRMPQRWVGGLTMIVIVCTAVLAFSMRSWRSKKPDLVWGEKGTLAGRMVRPRAATVDLQGRIYIVDFTARIQAYNANGEHLGITWQTPDYRNGRPSGLGTAQDGSILVCDSHYHCVRIYSGEGELIKTLGGQGGKEPGQFGYISDCVQDVDGNYFVSEFGQNDRITKLDSKGQFLKTWGRSGIEPGEFQRVRALAIGPDGLLYTADACNHRIQVFTREGEFVRTIGQTGTKLGEFSYPYDLAFNASGDFFVVERGNMRIQKMTKDGKPLGSWGGPGSQPGELADPWAVVVDHKGNVHVIDTENHRVQKMTW